MAFSPASSLAPPERITCRTVGSAVGIAAIANAIAVMNNVSAGTSLDKPSMNMMIIVPSAAAPIHKVNVFSCLVSGDCSLLELASMPAILPTWASAPLAVTIIVPLPCVTGVFMNAMFFWSPAPISASASVSAAFEAGVLSPVRADSSMLSELAWMIRPSAETLSPAVINTMSPRTTSSMGIADSTPPRRTRAVCFVSDLSAFIALSALPSCRKPTTAFTTVSRINIAAVLHSPMASESAPAISRMICM